MPRAGNGCRLFVCEEVLPNGRVLLRLLLLHVYLRALWQGEAGKLERNPAQELSNPPPERSWQVGFFFYGLLRETKIRGQEG